MKGKEAQRWIKDLEIDNYRKALDEALGRPARSRAPTSQAASP